MCYYFKLYFLYIWNVTTDLEQILKMEAAADYGTFTTLDGKSALGGRHPIRTIGLVEWKITRLCIHKTLLHLMYVVLVSVKHVFGEIDIRLSPLNEVILRIILY